jgi:uncharacterized membrane protein
MSARNQRRAAAFIARTSVPVPLEASARRSGQQRFDRLDALRGAAIVWMAAFHFSFDLNYFGFVHQDFYRDPVWTLQRACIVTLFMLCVGAGQGIAVAQGQSLSRFWKRVAQIAGCALLVSIGSWVMFPASFISFGVLHAIALMLVFVRFTTSWGAWRWLLGGIAMLLPLFVADPFFDSRWTNWVGLTTHKPVTEDYAPILPWLGVVWWGAAAAEWLLGRHASLLRGSVPRAARPLAVLGRWSLSFYMLHQPVLIGLLWLATMLRH